MLSASTTWRYPSDDSGISLVEVLTAMVISMIVGSMTVLFLLSAVGNARRADGQNQQAAGARTILDSWASLVPLAVDPNGESAPGSVRFYSIGPLSVRFCAALGSKSMVGLADAAPIGVELALVGDDIVEKRYTTCALMVANGTHVRRLLAPAASVAAPGRWLFTPLALGDLRADGGANGPLTSSITTAQQTLSALVQADADKIGTVVGLQLAFTTLPAPGRPAPPATYTALLGLNAGG